MSHAWLTPRWLVACFLGGMLMVCAWVMWSQTNHAQTPPVQTGFRVDVNHATLRELAALPGLGPATAGRIIADRDDAGRFATPEDLTRVNGIGLGKLAQLRPWITCGPGVAKPMDARPAGAQKNGPLNGPSWLDESAVNPPESVIMP